MGYLKHALRGLREVHLSLRNVARGKTPPESQLIPIIVHVVEHDIPPWLRFQEVIAAVDRAAHEAVGTLWRKGLASPAQMLACKKVPAELRSKAGRTMLAMRGGKATAAKMRSLGYPNLVKAREAKRRKATGTDNL